MQVGIYHTINDAKKWKQTTQNVMGKIKEGTLPKGLKPVLLIPDTKQKTTFCLWEAASVDSLKTFMDDESGNAARNEYFEVDTKNAIGLQELAAARK